jgi:transmembrane sensor
VKITPIRRLAVSIVPLQDRALAKLPLAPLDDRVAALRARGRARARRRRAWGALGAAGVAAAAALYLWARPAPLRFDVGAARARGVVGARVEAPAFEPLLVHFSDGTEMSLAGGSRARVVSLDPRGAHVVVERGAVRAAVVPGAASAWVVAVGPFDVHVKGTRFEAAWDERREAFSLKMREGAVVITSRCLPAPRTSVAGESLELPCAGPGPEAAVEPGSPPPAPSPPAAPSTSASTSPLPATSAPPAARALFAPSTSTSTSPLPATLAPPPARAERWRAPLGRGDSNGALALLEQAGALDQACATASAPELMRLGEAARSAGRRVGATRIYRAVRARFPDSPLAALAAFHLGQIAFDQGGSLAEAREGFTAYLDERPSGELAQEALGRLLEVERRAGAPAAARALAARYLERFPRGPHAELARAMTAP